MAASINSNELLVPWMGDASTLVDRFDARLLLDALPAPSTAAAAAGPIAEADQMDPAALEALLERERWRSLPEADGGSGDSESSDGASRRVLCAFTSLHTPMKISHDRGAPVSAWCMSLSASRRRWCRRKPILKAECSTAYPGGALCSADEGEGVPGRDSGKAAMPYTYDQPGTTMAAGQAKGDMQAVGFSYSNQAATAEHSGEGADGGEAEPNADAAVRDTPTGVPTVQPQPFVPRFEAVPEDLRDHLPETERMHKVVSCLALLRPGMAPGTGRFCTPSRNAAGAA